MNQSTQQTYYDQHYSICDNSIWKSWTPDKNFVEREHLSDFKQNLFQTTNAQYNILAELSEVSPFNTVLDVGCSTGEFLIPLSKVAQNVYGIDIVNFSSAWELMHQKYNVHCQQLNLDYLDLPFPEQTFDLVTMLMVLEHVFDVHHSMQEVARVLKMGGIAVFQVPNIACLKHRLDLFRGKLPCTSNVQKADNRTEWDGQHLHYFTLASLNALLNQYGLQPYKIRCSGKLAQLRWFLPSVFGADLTVFARKAC